MNGKKPTGSDIGSDLKKADALSIMPKQFEEIPELTEEWFRDAEPHIGGRKVGRPKSASPKVPLKLRLDREVVQAFRATGPGWQTRINATLRLSLRKAAGAPALKRRLKRRLKRQASRTTRTRRRA
jgi:uncharacterized protein (DUF4415 family)